VSPPPPPHLASATFPYKEIFFCFCPSLPEACFCPLCPAGPFLCLLLPGFLQQELGINSESCCFILRVSRVLRPTTTQSGLVKTCYLALQGGGSTSPSKPTLNPRFLFNTSLCCSILRRGEEAQDREEPESRKDSVSTSVSLSSE
jgi:hypothetical protein